eukprot:3339096-Pleurochrysis_carterae.AAC.2
MLQSGHRSLRLENRTGIWQGARTQSKKCAAAAEGAVTRKGGASDRVAHDEERDDDVADVHQHGDQRDGALRDAVLSRQGQGRGRGDAEFERTTGSAAVLLRTHFTDSITSSQVSYDINIKDGMCRACTALRGDTSELTKGPMTGGCARAQGLERSRSCLGTTRSLGPTFDPGAMI